MRKSALWLALLLAFLLALPAVASAKSASFSEDLRCKYFGSVNEATVRALGLDPSVLKNVRGWTGLVEKTLSAGTVLPSITCGKQVVKGYPLPKVARAYVWEAGTQSLVYLIDQDRWGRLGYNEAAAERETHQRKLAEHEREQAEAEAAFKAEQAHLRERQAMHQAIQPASSAPRSDGQIPTVKGFGPKTKPSDDFFGLAKYTYRKRIGGEGHKEVGVAYGKLTAFLFEQDGLKLGLGYTGINAQGQPEKGRRFNSTTHLGSVEMKIRPTENEEVGVWAGAGSKTGKEQAHGVGGHYTNTERKARGEKVASEYTVYGSYIGAGSSRSVSIGGRLYVLDEEHYRLFVEGQLSLEDIRGFLYVGAGIGTANDELAVAVGVRVGAGGVSLSVGPEIRLDKIADLVESGPSTDAYQVTDQGLQVTERPIVMGYDDNGQPRVFGGATNVVGAPGGPTS